MTCVPEKFHCYDFLDLTNGVCRLLNQEETDNCSTTNIPVFPSVYKVCNVGNKGKINSAKKLTFSGD